MKVWIKLELHTYSRSGHKSVYVDYKHIYVDAYLSPEDCEYYACDKFKDIWEDYTYSWAEDVNDNWGDYEYLYEFSEPPIGWVLKEFKKNLAKIDAISKTNEEYERLITKHKLKEFIDEDN